MRYQIELLAAGLAVSMGVSAQVDNLRITEVDPDGDQVEVTNVGDPFTTSANRPFCHGFDYFSNIPSGTQFDAGQARLFTVNNLDDPATDLWIYRSSPFGNSNNIIHGLQYGAGNIGRAALASGIGLWSGAETFAPAPPAGTTLAWDGFGNTSFDWYVDETPSLGSADPDDFGTVASTLAYPSGTRDFESLLLGDLLSVIQDWPIVDSSPPGAFTVRTVSDVMGVPSTRGTSTQWMRIHDGDPADVQNRFYGPTISAPELSNYEWFFFAAPEAPPPASGNFPRFTIQHSDGGFANAWGIEYRLDGIYLVVIGVGGVPAEILMESSTYPDDLGQWKELALMVDFDTNMVSATIDGGAPVALPINLAPSANPAEFRFCYRGEGVGNVGTFLMDDVGFAATQADTIFRDSFE